MQVLEGVKFHTFQRHGRYFLLDVNSSEIYEIDELAYRVLQMLPRCDETSVVHQLAWSGYSLELIQETVEEVRNLFNQFGKREISSFALTDYIDALREVQPSAITLMVAQDCNLRCRYCYSGGDGTYGAQIRFMSKSIAHKAIDFLIERSPELEHYEIYFFGGEPLLNLTTIQDAVNYCRELEQMKGKHFHFGLTTNATLITATIAQWLVDNHFSILISLDGPPEAHNRYRVFADGCGSFDHVMRGIEKLRTIETDFPLAIRCSVARGTPSLQKLVHFFEDIGCQRIYISPVMDIGDGNEWALTKKDLADFHQQTLELGREILAAMLKGRRMVYNPFLHGLSKIHNEARNVVSCGIGKAMMAISTEGKLYPCHRFVGIQNCILGDVLHGIDHVKWENFFTNCQRVTSACENCWAKFICARGCIRYLVKLDGTFVPPDAEHCAYTRDALEELIYMYAIIREKRPDLLTIFEAIPATLSSTESAMKARRRISMGSEGHG